MALDLEIQGVGELQEQLIKVLPSSARTILRRAVRQAARVIRDDAKRRAPRDSGQLKKGIKEKETAPGVGQVGARVFVSKAPHAHLIEYGHRQMYKNPRNTGELRQSQKTPFVAAQPFMRPAFEENYSAAHEQMREAIREGIFKRNKKVLQALAEED